MRRVVLLASFVKNILGEPIRPSFCQARSFLFLKHFLKIIFGKDLKLFPV